MTKITIRSTNKSPITKNLKLQNPQVCILRSRKTNDAQQTILQAYNYFLIKPNSKKKKSLFKLFTHSKPKITPPSRVLSPSRDQQQRRTSNKEQGIGGITSWVSVSAEKQLNRDVTA